MRWCQIAEPRDWQLQHDADYDATFAPLQAPETSAAKSVAKVAAKLHGFPLEMNGKPLNSLFYVFSFAPQVSIMRFPRQHTQFEEKKIIGVMMFYKYMTSIEPNENVASGDIIWRGSGSHCVHVLKHLLSRSAHASDVLLKLT